MRWWLLIKQFPKWALVFGLIIGSTLLFCGWWLFHSRKQTVAHPPVVADISSQLALVESKWERLLLVDNDLYDLDTGKLLFKHWLQSDMPLRLFYDATSKKMIAQYERGFLRYGLDGREEARLAQKDKAAFSADLKWAVYAKEKEVWRADIDWQAFRFINERKVTAIEQFNEANFAANVLALTDKTLIVRNFNALLRVNLETGSVKPIRLPVRDIGKQRSLDSRWMAGMSGSQFFCYDADADEAKSIPLNRASATSDYLWLGNDKCLALAAGGRGVVVYDRLANTLSEVTALPFPCFRIGEPSPDGRFVFCAGGINGSKGALVDVEKKTAVQITGGAGISWVSNDTFAYSREVPDSDLRGIWLQTAGQAERRVSTEPYLVTNSGAQLLAVPNAGLVIFMTKSDLTKMEPNGKDLMELVRLPRPAARVMAVQKWKHPAFQIDKSVFRPLRSRPVASINGKGLACNTSRDGSNFLREFANNPNGPIRLLFCEFVQCHLVIQVKSRGGALK